MSCQELEIAGLFRDKIQSEGKILLNSDGEVILYQNFFREEESSLLFQALNQQVEWQQDHIKIYGKSIPLPRLTAWYGDKSYTYSGIALPPKPWIPALQIIKSRAEMLAATQFNSVLLNLYRNGSDGVGWHSDDESELGENPVIASISFGATRRFAFKHKFDKERKKIEVDLTNGSLLLMKGKTQHFWLHQISKTKKQVQPRINLTFRVIH